MIDLRRLQVLRAVAHYGTVTAAANALHFTPSAASQQVRQLGRDLGVTLLEPHGRRVRLTLAAQRLLAHADAIEARWERARGDLHSEVGELAGPVRLGAFPAALSALLAPLTEIMTKKHPRLTVQVMEVDFPASFDKVFDGDLDMVIVHSGPRNPSLGDVRFDQRPLLDDPYDLVVGVDHPFARRESIDLAESAWEDWILAPEGVTCRSETLSACGTAGFTPNVVHNAVEWQAIAGLIAHGLGVALIPRMAQLPPHLPVVRVPCVDRPCRKLLTCTRNGARDLPVIAAVMAELESLAASVCVQTDA